MLTGSLRFRGDFPVVGDYVEITENPYGDSLIREICPRRSVFWRPDRGGHEDAFVKNLGSPIPRTPATAARRRASTP